MPRQSLLSAFAVCFVLALVAGCGDDDDGGSKRRRRSSGTGGKKVSEILVGTWDAQITIDDDKATAFLRKLAAGGGKQPTEDQIKAGVEKLKTEITKFQFSVTFNSDGTTSASKTEPNGKTDTMDGKWEILKEDGPKVTLKLTDARGRDKDKPEEFQVTVEDDKTLRVDDSSQMKEIPGTMRFKKR